MFISWNPGQSIAKPECSEWSKIICKQLGVVGIACGKAGVNLTARGRNQPSKHQGEYWTGIFEKYNGNPELSPGQTQGDRPTGTLTSVPFVVSRRIDSKKLHFSRVAALFEKRFPIDKILAQNINETRVLKLKNCDCHNPLYSKIPVF